MIRHAGGVTGASVEGACIGYIASTGSAKTCDQGSSGAGAIALPLDASVKGRERRLARAVLEQAHRTIHPGVPLVIQSQMNIK